MAAEPAAAEPATASPAAPQPATAAALSGLPKRARRAKWYAADMRIVVAPPPAAASLVHVDVGEPAPLAVCTAHPLVGCAVAVANAVWSAGATGSTRCTIVGFAADEERGGHRGVYAVRDNKDKVAYAITHNQLKVFFAPRHTRLLASRT